MSPASTTVSTTKALPDDTQIIPVLKSLIEQGVRFVAYGSVAHYLAGIPVKPRGLSIIADMQIDNLPRLVTALSRSDAITRTHTSGRPLGSKVEKSHFAPGIEVVQYECKGTPVSVFAYVGTEEYDYENVKRESDRLVVPKVGLVYAPTARRQLDLAHAAHKNLPPYDTSAFPDNDQRAIVVALKELAKGQQEASKQVLQL